MDAVPTQRPEIFLAPGRDKRVRGGHPWIYSNEIKMDAEAKALPPGTLVTVRRVDGKPLGVASFNPHALIACRLWDRDYTAELSGSSLAKRLGRALEIREQLFNAPFYRLIHAEADGFPGFVVDRFGDDAVVQANTAGAEIMLETVIDAVDQVISPSAIVLRGDTPARRQEGLAETVSVIKGSVDGPVEGREGEVRFAANLISGQKTGWFFDQRDNRAFAAKFARDRDVLDVYCYGGGFGVSAALHGAASVTGVDRSENALESAARTAELSGASHCSWRKSDAYGALEGFAEDRRRFGLVIADPPAFVKSRKDLKAGLRGYRKLARLCAQAVDRQGYLFIASCSHNVGAEDFLSEVGRGIASAGRSARLLHASGAAGDHPVHPHLPESAYLKGLFFALD